MAIIIDGGKIMTVAAAKAQGLPFPVGLHDESTFTVRPQRPASSAPARHTPPAAPTLAPSRPARPAARAAAPRATPQPDTSRLDALLADYKARVDRDERKADMAAAVEAGVTRALRTAKKTDPFRDDPSHLDPDDDDDEDDRDDEDDEEDEDEKKAGPTRKQRDEAAAHIRALAGIPERPRFQIGNKISSRPDPNRLQGYLEGSRAGSWQAPMPTSTPPGRSPLHNRGGK